MRTIREFQEGGQKELFDTGEYGWWHRELAPQALARLEGGIEGLMRRSVLRLMPAEELGKNFHASEGRPTKELHAMAGLLLLAEFHNWTVDGTAYAWTYDKGVQYALGLNSRGEYLSPRTVDEYRRLVRESGAAREVYEHVTSVLVKEAGISVRKQRLDSTHVLSNMASFGRLKLLGVAVRRFLVQLKRHDLEEYEALDGELRERYEPSESRVFGMGTKTPGPYEESIRIVAEDMAFLSDRFSGEERIADRTSFKALERICREHCEITGKGGVLEVELREKAVDGEGKSSGVMQNPSDGDAGYDGHKGAGYQVQLSQVYGEEEGEPGVVAGCLAQSAAESDSESEGEVMGQQERMGTLPGRQLADTAYGSQKNVELCGGYGVELVAPVPGRRKKLAGEPKGGNGKAVSGETGKEEVSESPLDRRRRQEETDEWKRIYAKRSGVEGLNRALDLSTGLKSLRVRGMKAVEMAIYFKVTGWNMRTIAAHLRKRRKTDKMSQQTGKTGLIFAMNSLLGVLRSSLMALSSPQNFSQPQFHPSPLPANHPPAPHKPFPRRYLYIKFLKRLVASSKRKVYVIADNLVIHHGKLVTAWVEQHTDEIELQYIPSYSPELNADEYLNRDAKKNINIARTPRSPGELKKNVSRFMTFLQKTPSRVMQYFNGKPIQYAAAQTLPV